MKVATVLFFISLGLVYSENVDGILGSLPSDFLADLVAEDAKLGASKDSGEENFKLSDFNPMKSQQFSAPGHSSLKMPFGTPKLVAPVKRTVLKKVVATKVMAPKVVAKKLLAPKVVAAKVVAPVKIKMATKPKVYKLKPIVHVIEKPVPVYHKVPVPKKVIVPKFYPVIKPIPIPKVIPVPFKVPVVKIVPKIVKIPKPIPVPKIIPVKKPVPIGIPYPVPKFYKVPIPKPVPYAKYIPIPIPKKVPKFIPVPIKKVIKVPKPFYVPIKVPHITTSYIKTPMAVDVPDVKKDYGKSMLTFLPSEGDKFKFTEGKTSFQQPLGKGLGQEDKDLLKLLSGGLGDEGKLKI